MLTKTDRNHERFGERNARIMRERIAQHDDAQLLMLDVNHDWFTRMWDTPDVAMCLGRYS